VCACAGKDDTGEISVSLWNEQIEQVNEGSKIKITDGWCSEFRNEKQVSTGRKGKLEVLS
jgi:replication factor A1